MVYYMAFTLVTIGLILLLSKGRLGRKILVIGFLGLITFGVIGAIGLMLTPEPPELFVEVEGLTVDEKTFESGKGYIYPWYASDQTHRYVLYPGIYFKIPRDTRCRQRTPFESSPRCADWSKPQCYPNAEGCGYIPVAQ